MTAEPREATPLPTISDEEALEALRSALRDCEEMDAEWAALENTARRNADGIRSNRELFKGVAAAMRASAEWLEREIAAKSPCEPGCPDCPA